MIFIALLYLSCVLIIISILGSIVSSHIWLIVLILSLGLFFYSLSELKKMAQNHP